MSFHCFLLLSLITRWGISIEISTPILQHNITLEWKTHIKYICFFFFLAACPYAAFETPRLQVPKNWGSGRGKQVLRNIASGKSRIEWYFVFLLTQRAGAPSASFGEFCFLAIFQKSISTINNSRLNIGCSLKKHPIQNCKMTQRAEIPNASLGKYGIFVLLKNLSCPQIILGQILDIV